MLNLLIEKFEKQLKQESNKRQSTLTEELTQVNLEEDSDFKSKEDLKKDRKRDLVFESSSADEHGHILRFITNKDQSLFILPKQLKYYDTILEEELPKDSRITKVIDYITPNNDKVFIFKDKEDFPNLKKSVHTLDIIENKKYSVEDALKLTNLQSSKEDIVIKRYPKNKVKVAEISGMPSYIIKMFDNKLNQLNGFGFQDKSGYSKILFEQQLSKDEIKKLAKEYLKDKSFDIFDGKGNTSYKYENNGLEESLETSRGQWNQAETARQFGVYDKLKSLEKDLLTIKGVTNVDFDLDGLYDDIGFVIITDFDIPSENYLDERRRIASEIKQIARKHAVYQSDPMELEDNYIYWAVHFSSNIVKNELRESLKGKK